MSQTGDREDAIMPGGIAMLLQHHVDAGVTPEAVRDQMLADWPDLGPITVMPPSDMDDEDDAVAQFSLECGNAIIIVTTMDSQFADDTADLCAGSRLWPDTATFDTDYQATTIVAVYFEDEDAADIAVRALLTQAMASIIAVSNEAFAVYWGDADHVIIPPLFREMAQEILPNPPLYLWVAFNAGFREGGEFASTTVGLDSLGLMDIEIPDSSKTPEDTQEFILNLVIYLLESGPVIADGDTVGESETERIRAVYTESMFYPDKTVIQLRNEQSGSDKGNGKPKRSWFRRGRR